MYINPFLAGILFTICTEIIVATAYSFYLAKKEDHEDDEVDTDRGI